MDTISTGSITENPNLQLLTLDEAAEILKVNPTTVGRKVQRGEIASVHFGRSVRIRRQDLERFIISHVENGGYSGNE